VLVDPKSVKKIDNFWDLHTKKLYVERWWNWALFVFGSHLQHHLQSIYLEMCFVVQLALRSPFSVRHKMNIEHIHRDILPPTRKKLYLSNLITFDPKKQFQQNKQIKLKVSNCDNNKFVWHKLILKLRKINVLKSVNKLWVDQSNKKVDKFCLFSSLFKYFQGTSKSGKISKPI